MILRASARNGKYTPLIAAVYRHCECFQAVFEGDIRKR